MTVSFCVTGDGSRTWRLRATFFKVEQLNLSDDIRISTGTKNVSRFLTAHRLYTVPLALGFLEKKYTINIISATIRRKS